MVAPFAEVSFPARLAFGSTGGVERRTEVVTLASGFERRATPWANGRRRYLVGQGVRKLADAAELQAFFEARRGRLQSFRFRDFTDAASAPPGAAPSATDQRIGTGDGATAAFALAKTYGDGADAYARPIAKPVAGTVLVAVNGSAAAFTMDATTGVVTLAHPPAAGAVVTAGFLFDVPVRFDPEPTGDGGFVLSGLLRGQLGSGDAMTGVEAGAPFVRLGREPARLSASASERGSPLVWRVAPSGGPPGGIAMSEVVATWRAKAWRPFSPAQLRGVRTSEGLRLSWVRRARIGGDSWEGEVPLEEPVERYLVTVLAGGAAGGRVVEASTLELAPPDLTSAPYALRVAVAQWGAMWGGWGAALERTLLL